MWKKLTYLVSVCLVLAAATGVQAVELTVYPDADTYVRDNDTAPHGSDVYMYLNGVLDAVGYLRFDLAKLNVTSVQEATLTLRLSGGAPRNDNVVAGRFSLQGLNNAPGNTPQNWAEATLTSATVGAEWSTNAGEPIVNTTNMDDTVAGMTESIVRAAGANYWDPGAFTFTLSGAPLLQFIQSRVDDNGLVTFLLVMPGADDRGYGIASKENTTEDYRPILVIQATTGPKTGAINPSPIDGATEVLRDAVLSWTPGVFAATHNVYFGTDSDAVTNGDASVLVGPGQTTNTYDPPGHMDFGQTYYWRVDEVNDAPDFAVTNGGVWSFTVEQYSYPITDVNATASSFDTGAGPENTVNGSGLDATGLLHSTLDKAMWVTSQTTTFPHSITFAFDKVYKLDQMWVWNYNVSLESVFGIGCKDVKIEYSLNGTKWDVLTESTEFVQGASAENYAHNTSVDFAGAAAQYVRLTISSNWRSLLQQAGLSEVRFFYIPVTATAPVPASPTANVDPRTAVLSWRAGREASSHELYLATDANAVTDGTAAVVTPSQASYAPPSLLLDSTYYWKVIEVNQAEIPTSWPSGEPWSFSTLPYITIDNFESYTNDSPNRVFQAWIDGGGFSPDDFFPNGGAGNGTGSYAGYDPQLGDIMEMSIVHGGRQSMPLYYDNTAAPKVSEAQYSFDEAQDWSKHGITTLVLYFRGDVNNVSAPVYVKINGGTPVYYNGGAPSTAIEFWKPFVVDLAQFGASRNAVKTLTIGVGNGTAGGTGTIYVDDVLLYPTAPVFATPVDPGTNGLAALYSMEDNVDDGSGNQLNGTITGNPFYVNSRAGLGKALSFDGGTDTINDYVDLPIGSLIGSMSSGSFATWVYFTNTGGNWQRIFDFGMPATTPNTYMFLTLNNANARTVRFATRNAASTEEQYVNAPAPALQVGWHHVAIVVDSAAMALRLYQDGVLVGTGTTNILPSDLGVTTQNSLGRSLWSADAYLNASLDDFRIFDRALSEGEVRYLAGDQ